MENKKNVENKSQNNEIKNEISLDRMHKVPKESTKSKVISWVAGTMVVATAIGAVVKYAVLKPRVTISNTTTISSTLDSVKDETELDENISEFLDEEQTLKALDEAYLECRKNSDREGCNRYLYQMGDLILKAKVAACLNINPKNIKDIDYFLGETKFDPVDCYMIRVKYDVDSFLPGNIKTTKTCEAELYADGDLYNLLYNTVSAGKEKWYLIENYDQNSVYINDKITIDDVYKSFQRAILCSEQEIPTIFSEEGCISSELNTKYVDAYNQHLKTLKK